ncbi:hypothetical protein SAE02_61840 [Skermanella aerolata]|uniref:Uncharacterized protein n=2 Tax=Skermanella aerolata TaxID=393310 RepID=A0A512DZY3_9PROT|nr:hypothetical protein N826_25405 [Skermanella aerolata KACC 11604]GEO42036.1 hypothetical protein SAE02_61840 [Skermanella aerolata]
MSWKSLTSEEFRFCLEVRDWLEDLLGIDIRGDMPASALPPDEEIIYAEFRLGRQLTEAEELLGSRMLRWLRIRRTWGGGRVPLLPNEADLRKSALFERLRNALEPLDYPPPLGLDCPWYALVEDPGPHRADSWEIDFGDAPGKHFWAGPGDVCFFKNIYEILERTPEESATPKNPTDQVFIVRSKGLLRGRQSPYRFRLWFEAKEDIRRRPNPPSLNTGGNSIILPVPFDTGSSAWLVCNAKFWRR